MAGLRTGGNGETYQKNKAYTYTPFLPPPFPQIQNGSVLHALGAGFEGIRHRRAGSRRAAAARRGTRAERREPRGEWKTP